jgi:hypothetical protein
MGATGRRLDRCGLAVPLEFAATGRALPASGFMYTALSASWTPGGPLGKRRGFLVPPASSAACLAIAIAATRLQKDFSGREARIFLALWCGI